MIAAAVAALLLMPLVVLRGATLAVHYLTAAALWGFAWIVWLRVPSVAPLAVVVVHAVVLMLFVATGANVRWSANRAAVLAAAVYGFMVVAMTRFPIDGDEPFYLLVTESIVRDFDLDLANQYRDLSATASGRTDLVPQLGDPVRADGKQYSRHEPFLPLLMVPGYVAGGLHGAIATIALFGVLLVRSTIRWMEDEGVPEAAARAVFPLFAFAPPVLFYAARIWPEVPAAFCFVEALRGLRGGRPKRWLPAIFALVMLKLRFGLVVIALLAARLRGLRARRWVIVVAILVAPVAILWLINGSPLNVHSPRELLPAPPAQYAKGFFGLLLDGAAGIAFQAPFYLLGIVAITRWRETPRGFRLGVAASLLYLLYLMPRDEWHGGWSPPLRYIVFLMPVLALGAASIWHRVSRGVVAAIAIWTAGLALHGIAFPWRLFHIANGETLFTEWLSNRYAADFSRLVPSLIRPNDAAWWGAAALAGVLVLARLRIPSQLALSAIALALAAAFVEARKPGRTIHFEDAHLTRDGGELYPPEYTPIRFAYRGGWILEAGQSFSFLAAAGPYTLHYVTGPGARIELEGTTLVLPPDASGYSTARLVVPRSGRVTLRCVEGAVNLDRMDHD